MVNQISKYIADVYGSKKGLVRYFYSAILDKFLNVYSQNKKLPADIRRVVFVCKGNICRSAVAEWSFKSTNSLVCCSVGLDTSSGKGANERIREISCKYGISLDEHITTAIEDFSPMAGDLFVCMEPSQLKQLQEKIGNNSSILLGLFGQPSCAYIHDPYNTNEVFAEECIKYICSAVSQLSNELSAAKGIKL